jgi:hypothetical protein
MKRITFQLDDLLAARVKAMASASGMTLSQYAASVFEESTRQVVQVQHREIVRFAGEIARRAEVRVLERLYGDGAKSAP